MEISSVYSSLEKHSLKRTLSKHVGLRSVRQGTVKSGTERSYYDHYLFRTDEGEGAFCMPCLLHVLLTQKSTTPSQTVRRAEPQISLHTLDIHQGLVCEFMHYLWLYPC